MSCGLALSNLFLGAIPTDLAGQPRTFAIWPLVRTAGRRRDPSPALLSAFGALWARQMRREHLEAVPHHRRQLHVAVWCRMVGLFRWQWPTSV